MTEFYYGTQVKHSYFRGGSTGGRQAMMIAQRYPHDFDAIIMGYAAFNKTGIPCTQDAYISQITTNLTTGTAILHIADLHALSEGAIAEW
jgi:hypothetical protein